jgi:membrane-associated HD superfamily phosphohydrolase
MKKWQEILLWIVCFAFVDITFEFIKTLIENGTLNKWIFALFALAIFVIGWTIVFISAKSLKNKKTAKKNSWVVGFIYFVIIWSVCMIFDLMKYSLENNILNIYYFFGIGFALMFTGWACGHLEYVLSKNKKLK